MSLKAKINGWDGKTVSVLQTVFDKYASTSGFADSVIDLLDTESSQPGASWLLKAWLEQGNTLNDRQQAAFFSCLEKLGHWSSRLHALQSLPFMTIPDDHRFSLVYFLRKTLTEPNKFVRAWSYNGFYELACQYPEFQEETSQFFTMAMRDESASVKARIRNLQKRGF